MEIKIELDDDELNNIISYSNKTVRDSAIITYKLKKEREFHRVLDTTIFNYEQENVSIRN